MAEGQILGEAHNETVHRRDPTAHAELLALHLALQKVGEDRLLPATLYVTLEPCAQCAGAIVLTKVGRVVFGAYDQRCGMAGSVFDLLRDPQTESPAGGRRRADGRRSAGTSSSGFSRAGASASSSRLPMLSYR